MEGIHTIISSNILFDHPSDQIQCWANRRLPLATTLLKHSPLLIATQEGRKPQLEDLSNLLPKHKLCADHRPWIEERMYPCCFLSKEINTVHSSGDRWLSETPEVAGSTAFGSAFPRLFTWIKFTLAHKEMLFINVHLDHLSGNARSQQIRVLTEEVKKLKNPTDHLIIMGDFNDGPNSEIRKKLLSDFSYLTDPWLQLNKPEEASHHSFTGAYTEGQRIDWILLDNKIKCEAIFLDKSEVDGTWPSDHFPLVCKFRF